MNKTNERQGSDTYFNISHFSNAISDLISLLEFEITLLKEGKVASIEVLAHKKDELTKYVESQKRFIAAGANIEEKDKVILRVLAQKLHDVTKLNREEIGKSIYSINELVGVVYDKVSLESGITQYSKDGKKSTKSLKIDPPAISINEAV